MDWSKEKKATVHYRPECQCRAQWHCWKLKRPGRHAQWCPSCTCQCGGCSGKRWVAGLCPRWTEQWWCTSCCVGGPGLLPPRWTEKWNKRGYECHLAFPRQHKMERSWSLAGIIITNGSHAAHIFCGTKRHCPSTHHSCMSRRTHVRRPTH